MELVCLALLFIQETEEDRALLWPTPNCPISCNTQQSQDTHSLLSPLTFHLPALSGMELAFALRSQGLQCPLLALQSCLFFKLKGSFLPQTPKIHLKC